MAHGQDVAPETASGSTLIPGEPQRPKEILIDGRLYDLTGFAHPGGGVINFHAGGGDATETFIEFHYRSKKARKMLAAIPSRPAPKDPKADPNEVERLRKLSASYKKLRKEFEAEGRFKPNYMHVVYRFLEIFVMWVVGFGMLLSGSSWAYLLAEWAGLSTRPATTALLETLPSISVSKSVSWVLAHPSAHRGGTASTTATMLPPRSSSTTSTSRLSP